jgi:hypothetical protein
MGERKENVMHFPSLGMLLILASVACQEASAQSCMGTPMETIPPPGYSGDGGAGLPPPPPTYNPVDTDPGSPGGTLPPGGGGSGGIIVVPPGGPTSGNAGGARTGTCVAGTSPSDVGGFSRQTSGYVSYSGNRFGLKGYTGDMTSLASVAQGTWPSYHTGYSITPNINSGCYIALEFSPTSSGAIEFTSDPSYGDPGLISLSTEPGEFSTSSSSVICSMSRGGANSIYITTPDMPSQCHVQIGQTYFINMQNSDSNGVQQCFGLSAYQCKASQVSYSLVTSGN